jgi:hypothetical protein
MLAQPTHVCTHKGLGVQFLSYIRLMVPLDQQLLAHALCVLFLSAVPIRPRILLSYCS